MYSHTLLVLYTYRRLIALSKFHNNQLLGTKTLHLNRLVFVHTTLSVIWFRYDIIRLKSKIKPKFTRCFDSLNLFTGNSHTFICINLFSFNVRHTLNAIDLFKNSTDNENETSSSLPGWMSSLCCVRYMNNYVSMNFCLYGVV